MRRRGHESNNVYADGGLSAIWDNAPVAHSESSFSSAVRRTNTTPPKRRRGSDAVVRRERSDHDPSSEDGANGSHSRSRTVDDEVGGTYWIPRRSASQHPLRPSRSLASTSSWTLDHETRPTMQRMLSNSSVHADEPVWERDVRGDESLGRDREMLVIVHEVQPKDSLAGVALKYGINLAELRRANQLWTSDSIHLRRVLYIPVDKTRHAKQLRTTLIELTLNPSSTSSSIHSDATVFDTNIRRPTTIDHELPDIGKLTIRRVPASQLSFFPPSNHPLHLEGGTATLESSATLPANGRTSRDRPALPVSFTRSTESPLQGILDVFSSSLHITAHHLRQSSGSLFGNGNGGGGTAVRAPATLASRLSSESNSGTPSSTSDDFDWEHEMEVVNTSKIPRRTGTGTGNFDAGARTRKRSHHARQASASLNDLHTSLSTTAQDERDSVELDTGPFTSAAISQSPPHTPTHSRNSSSRSQPAITPPSNSSVGSRGRGRRIVPYVVEGEALEEWGSPRGPRGKSVVRTAQLEPSPRMQFPLKPRTGTNPKDTT